MGLERVKEGFFQRFFCDGRLDIFYLTPALVWSKRHRILAILWIRWKVGMCT